MKENFENANTLFDFLSKEKELRAVVIKKHRKQYPDDVSKLEEKINDQRTNFEKDFLRKQTGLIQAEQQYVVNEYNNTMKNRFDKINEKKLDHLHNDAAKKSRRRIEGASMFCRRSRSLEENATTTYCESIRIAEIIYSTKPIVVCQPK